MAESSRKSKRPNHSKKFKEDHDIDVDEDYEMLNDEYLNYMA